MKKTLLVILLTTTLLLHTSVNAKSLSKDCVSNADNASYTGVYKGVENNLSLADFDRDFTCADKFIKSKYPNRFFTIFGSSRIHEKNSSGNKKIDEANDKLYKQIYNLAYKWTKYHSSKYPVLSGAGPGIMEAASRGATDAGGPSIGYTTYYGPSRNKKGGDASKAFWMYRPEGKKPQTIFSDGLIFTSVAVRESVMILHSAAMVFAPGGTGTEWEIFQTIEQMKSGQLTPVPIYIVGDRKIHWKSLYDRLEDMMLRGTIEREEVESLITHIDNPEDVFELMTKDLNL